ncbi:unnamed protein product, partial [Mesorhabditis spiculigera]
MADVEETNRLLDEKYEYDKQRVAEMLRKRTNGCQHKIKKMRWLICSTQTYGLFDGATCYPAELGICEFDFNEGILETFSTPVGPWNIDNEVQRTRALYHASETHQMPLGRRGRLEKPAVCMEILGRTEPRLAAAHGVRVGLYRDEIDDHSRGFYHLEHSPKRRPLVCLRHEFRLVQASLRELCQSVNLQYEGFPKADDDFILAEALVDAVAEFFDGEPLREYPAFLKGLGSRLPRESVTPWEKRDGALFCPLHRPDRNSCCAAVTVSRAAYILLYALDHMLD